MDMLKDEKFFRAFLVISVAIVVAFLCQDNHQTNEDLPKKTFKDLNVTHRGNESFLFFNRVSKVGSTTITRLIAELQTVNNFNAFNLPSRTSDFQDGSILYVNNLSRRREAIDSLIKNVKGIYIRHKNFFDFREVADIYPNVTNPIYMNFVRHPIERFLSFYHYLRMPSSQFKMEDNAIIFSPTLGLFRMRTSYEECFWKLNTSECHFVPGTTIHQGQLIASSSQMAYFCGHHASCDEVNGLENLQRAKENVEKHYAVVGVLEEFDMSLKVLEGYLPRFFDGAYNIYKNKLNGLKVNRNLLKPEVSQDIKDILSKNMTREIEFYNFCQQRLLQQFDAIRPQWQMKIGITNSTT